MSRSTSAVLAMLNQAAKQPINLNQVQLGAPVAVTGKRSNTDMVLVAAPGSGRMGQITINYNRVNLAEIVQGQSVTFERELEMTVADFLPAINERFKVELSLDDVQNLSISSEGPTGISEFVLRADPDSLAWYGEVNLRARNVRPNDQPVAQLLSGLDYPEFVLVDNPHLNGFNDPDVTP